MRLYGTVEKVQDEVRARRMKLTEIEKELAEVRRELHDLETRDGEDEEDTPPAAQTP